MNLKERYRDFLLQLKSIYTDSEASIITDWIFEHILHINRSDLIKNPDHPISESANHHILLHCRSYYNINPFNIF